MRKVKRWRYYCDHCKKSGASKHHMQTHEKHCCANPQRACRMCEWATGEINATKPIVESIEVFDNGGLEALRGFVGNCPACILAALIQAGKRDKKNGDEVIWVDYDFKTEAASLWAEVKAERNLKCGDQP